MKTGGKLFTGTLWAFCAILLVLCALLAAGWNRASKNAAGVPGVRNNGTAIQWKYADGDEWNDLVSIAELRGDDGADGKDGTDCKDGVDCKNGADGINGKDGAERPVGIKVYKEAESVGLVSTYTDEVYLKKGHTYSVTISASMELQSHEDRSGNYSVQLTDNYDDGFCREATRIKRDGVKLPYSRDQHHFSFSRIYIASDEDIPLRFKIEQSSYKTTLLGFNGTITITALD